MPTTGPRATIALALAVGAALLPAGATADVPHSHPGTDASSGVAEGPGAAEGPAVPRELIVRFRAGAGPAARAAVHDAAHARRVERLLLPRTEVVRVPVRRSLRAAIDGYEDDPRVASVEPNLLYRVGGTPDDTLFPVLWGLHNTGQSGGTPDADIDAAEAWDVETGSDAVTVAVIDTGVDADHPDLSINMWANPGETPANGIDDDGNALIDDVVGWDYVNDDADPDDDFFHGTHVAGTIGAVGNNAAGVAGVAWDVSIGSLKVCDAGGWCPGSAILDGITYAGEMGFDVANLSLGGPGFSPTMNTAIASYPGTLYVAAAGNDAWSNDAFPQYPCSYDQPNVVCVASTDRNDQLSSFSNHGTSVHLAAPGSSIRSTIPGGGYATASGTSMATPHVAGAAAILRSADPGATTTEVRDAILGSVDLLSSLTGKTGTGGRLNLARAVGVAVAQPSHLQPPTPEPPPAPEPAIEPAPAKAAKSLLLRARPRKVERGTRARLVARIGPCGDHAGMRVTLLEKRDGPGWKGVGTKRTGARCKAVFSKRIGETKRYRARVGPDADHLAARSNRVRVRAV